MPVAAAVLNGVRDERFRDDEAPALAAVGRAPADGPLVARRGGGAAPPGTTSAPTRRYRERLAEGTRLPVLELPEVVRRRFDLDALEMLAARPAPTPAPQRAPVIAARRGPAAGGLLRRRRRRQDDRLGGRGPAAWRAAAPARWWSRSTPPGAWRPPSA